MQQLHMQGVSQPYLQVTARKRYLGNPLTDLASYRPKSNGPFGIGEERRRLLNMPSEALRYGFSKESAMMVFEKWDSPQGSGGPDSQHGFGYHSCMPANGQSTSARTAHSA